MKQENTMDISVGKGKKPRSFFCIIYGRYPWSIIVTCWKITADNLISKTVWFSPTIKISMVNRYPLGIVTYWKLTVDFSIWRKH